MNMVWWIFVLVTIAHSHAGEFNKDTDRLYCVTPKSHNQTNQLDTFVNGEVTWGQDSTGKWIKTTDSTDSIEMWADMILPFRQVDVITKTTDEKKLKTFLEKNSFEYRIEDLHKQYEEEKEDEHKEHQDFLNNAEKNGFHADTTFDYKAFNSFDKITTELNIISITSKVASTFNVGETYEGRKLIGLKISTGPKEGGASPKMAVWLDGGIHAREWITPATMMYFIKLVTSYPDRYKSVLDKFDLYVLPVFNADGYEYSRLDETTRFWRKTRTPNINATTNKPVRDPKTNKICFGTDPNRNWDAQWDKHIGASPDPCNDAYYGVKAESEPCVQAVVAYLKKLAGGPGLKAYFNIHAYSQLVMMPWSYKDSLPKTNGEELMRVGQIFAETVGRVHPSLDEYLVGHPPKMLYPVAGGSIDYTYETLGVKYSYALELRDTGRYHFLLPPNQIQPTGIETTAALMAMMDAMCGDDIDVPCPILNDADNNSSSKGKKKRKKKKTGKIRDLVTRKIKPQN